MSLKYASETPVKQFVLVKLQDSSFLRNSQRFKLSWQLVSAKRFQPATLLQTNSRVLFNLLLIVSYNSRSTVTSFWRLPLKEFNLVLEAVTKLQSHSWCIIIIRSTTLITLITVINYCSHHKWIGANLKRIWNKFWR